MRHRAFWAASIAVLFGSSPSTAQISMGPAPEGKAAAVAQVVIHDNFDKQVCPKVAVAQRFPDGTISAICNNDEKFRVFYMESVGNVALRCSAAAKLGITC